MRLKDVAHINRHALPEATDPGYSFKYIDISAVDNRGNIATPGELTRFDVAPSRARRVAPAGSTVVSTVRTYLRAIAQVPRTDEPLVFSTGFAVIEAKSTICDRFLAYICQSEQFIDGVVSRSVGVSYPAINPSDLGSIEVSLPSLDEQRRIADFLDGETARIDKLVSLRNEQVDELSEALCGEAVRSTGRHRLSSDQPEWQSVALRRVVEKVQTGTTPTELLQPIANSGHMPWYTPAALGGTLDLNAADKGVHETDARYVPRFRAGSILIVGIGESLGKVCDLDHEATGNQQLTAITTSTAIDRRFLAWQLFAAHNELRSWAQYSRIRILNNENLKSFMISIPPIIQQVESRKELDRRLAGLRAFRDAAAHFSVLASERRQALITAAVMGQIDVTAARGVSSPGGVIV